MPTLYYIINAVNLPTAVMLATDYERGGASPAGHVICCSGR